MDGLFRFLESSKLKYSLNILEKKQITAKIFVENQIGNLSGILNKQTWDAFYLHLQSIHNLLTYTVIGLRIYWHSQAFR
jgi:hypothetical protein